WKSEEYDKLYKASEGELDPAKRAALFIKMNDLAIQNGVVIPVVWRPRVRAISNKLKLEQSGSDSDFWNLQRWYRSAYDGPRGSGGAPGPLTHAERCPSTCSDASSS